jgi:hypothetical protein
MLRWLIVILFAAPLAAQAEMDVQRQGVSIVDGGTDSVTNTGTSPFNLTYTIRNDGSVALNLTGTPEVAISNESDCSVTILAAPSTPVAPAGSTTFILQVTPNSSASFSFDVSIANDDADENPYDFTFSATTTSPPSSNKDEGDSDDGNCSASPVGNVWTGLALALIAMALLRPKSLRRKA